MKTRKQDNQVDDSITLNPICHPALNQVFEILKSSIRAHKHVLKSPRLHSTPTSLSRVAFRNPKSKYVLSYKNLFIKMLASIFVVILTVICKILERGDQF